MEQVQVTVNGKTISTAKGTTISQLMKKESLDVKNILVAELNGKQVDLSTSVGVDADIVLHGFESPVGKEVFWHSSAHVLGNALVNLYGCKLVNGPPTADGFYYDVYSDSAISSDQFPEIEKEMMRIINKNIPFERVTKTKEELLDLYKDNEFKQHFINVHVENASTIYKNGDFFDMCRGPHIPSTGFIKAVKLFKTGAAYFLNDSSKPSLQRIYAVAYPSKALLTEHLERIRLAKERDHRKIGKDLDLFFFHKYSPGSCFWLPNGAHIYNKLMDYLRGEYRVRGFQEVITPNIFSLDLWKESGHYDNYKDNIYCIEKEDFALKPMNCPGHCLMFKNSEHSFKELPLRFADFGVLHRNELSGTLTGLTRVRRFQQDDAHIFCRRDQVKSEISSCIDFLKSVYDLFGFTFRLLLSTRPEKFLGELAEWNEAEDALRDAIKENGLNYELNEGDGAFYGPKIDIILCDALGRQIQCATIQLDFQLPQRFNLKFTNSEGKAEVPVMIHRAILGSIERMIAIILETHGKDVPFWLSPLQIALIPVAADSYAEELRRKLSNFRVKVFNASGSSFSKNIRTAEVSGYRLVCIVGKKEEETNEINIRTKSGNKNMPFDRFLAMVNRMAAERVEFNDLINLEGLSLN